MRRIQLGLAAPLAALLALAACKDAARPNVGQKGPPVASNASGTPIDLPTCTRCHGDAARGNAAPPMSPQGLALTTDVPVGAHQAHLGGAMTVRAPIACDECHAVPTSVDDAGHIDGDRATVRFDAPRSPGLASTGGAAPSWSRDRQTCSNVYCHGATLSGGAATTPVWTRVDGSQKACASCHGFPPTTVRGGTAPHPQSSACASCHPDTVDASLAIKKEGGKHIDGKVEVAGLACTTCHGDATRDEEITLNKAAPPSGPAGETSPTQLAVGAHQAHLHDGPFRQAVACASCHAVPTDGSHVDGVAAVTFDPTTSLATSGGASPAWNPSTATCSSTYCHGATLAAGGKNTAPRWTGGSAEAQCDSCHGIPPTSASHPPVSSARTGCNVCHPQTVDTAGNILVAGGKHVNGTVDVTSYHPVGWSSPGQHGTTANAGGLAQCQQCHGADLTGGAAGVSCDSCHTGATNAWRTTCTFCHGDAARSATVALVKAAPPIGVSGQTATTDRAVGAHQQHLVDGPAAKAVACAECHAVPSNVLDPLVPGHANGSRDVVFGTLAKTGGATPAWNGAGGAAATTCASTYCHGATLAGGAQKTPSWTKVDGSQAQCGSCHGAPPATASGAHAKVTALTQCATCHPGTVDAAGAVKVAGALHVNGTVDRAAYHPAGWGPSTNGIGHAAAANAGVAACVVCHGDAQGNGGFVNVACATCHKAGGSGHDFGTAATPGCTACHGGTLTGTDGAGVARAPAPPAATVGNSRPAGAHARHLTVDAAFAPAATFACAQCHALPTQALHATGAVDVAWGSVAAPAGQVGADGKPLAPAFDAAANSCASTWCHGNFRNGNAKTMSWTGTSADAACGSCHGLPPAGSHPSLATGTACGGCHAGYGGAVGGAASTFTVNAATHVNGVIDVSGAHPGGWVAASQHGLQAINVSATPGGIQSCTSCHLAFGSSDGTSATDCNACHAANGHPSWRTECTFCHGGNDNATGAPARDTHAVRGTAQATTLVTVGAHTSHVAAPHQVDAALDCTACHVKPVDATDPGHIDAATAAVTFGADAKLGGAAPAWNRTAATCASTYCHGATLNATTTRGSAATPVWTKADGTQATCGSCHQAPPGTANHHNAATTATCARCHAATVDATGAILVAGGKHLDGAVETSVTGCTTCHGNPSNPAPTGAQDANLAAAPTGAGAPDTYGNTATTNARVGVHASHVLGARSRAVACNACHVVPTTPVHKTGVATAATITFGNLATTGGATPAYAGSGGSCSATYCHGNFTGGAGTAATQAWTAAGTLGCTSCHGAPPPASTGHVQRTDCGSCHTGYTATTVNAATHVDGKVDVVALTCTSCHGNAALAPVAGSDANVKAAPPVDATGAASSAAVGAHQGHVNPASGAVFAPIGCAECHGSAVATYTTKHANGVEDVTFTGSTTAKLGGAAPAWNAATLSCASTYCHGGTLAATSKGSATAPAWTGAAATCGSCHAAPPSDARHLSATSSPASCNACHNLTVDATGAILVAGGKHLDGAVELGGATCHSCHGDATSDAPPKGTHGETATTTTAVGAHRQHLNAITLRQSPLACGDCHPAVTAVNHADGTVQTAFTSTLSSGTVWTKASASCATSYCHGGSGAPKGGAATAPVWTKVDGTQKACTSCHGAPPPASAGHVQRTDCGTCHTGYTSTSVNLATHINGTVDVVPLACTTCHGDATRVAVTGADANFGAAPPVDTTGATATTSRGVGVHQTHVNGSRSKPVACAECHANAVPTTSSHANGTTTVAFGTLAKTGGVTPTYAGTGGSCAATYCHGNFTGGAGAANATPAWTAAGALGCTSCHGAPPPASTGHIQRTDCGSCHAGYTATTVNAATHVNGTVDVVALTCTSCHGNAALAAVAGADANVKAAPPVDVTGATSSAAVGAHQGHVNPASGAVFAPIGCAECHGSAVATYTTKHANGVEDVTFANATTAKLGGAAPAWNAASLSCASTYCHGGTLAATSKGSATAPAWSGAAATCGSCHAAPPADARHLSATSSPASCNACHNLTVDATGAILVAGGKHLDGAVELGGATCHSCHGDATSDAPPKGTHGETATTTTAVGAHRQHLNAITLRQSPLACGDCHPAVTAVNHADGTVQTAFTSTLSTGTVWTKTTASCATSYCHGGSGAAKGGAATAPVWTKVDGTQKACTSCHGAPPPASSGHVQRTDCGSCHAGYTSTSVNLATHIDGKVDAVALACTTCHGDATRVAVTGADANFGAAPPVDTTGATATTSRGVGVHQTHVNGSRSKPVACSECHSGAVPTSTTGHTKGTTTVAFGTLAKTGGVTPTYAGAGGSCAATYCHGNFTGGAGATSASPAFIAAGTLGCTSCHGAPPALPHPQDGTCGDCHTGYTATTVNATTHVNGVVDLATTRTGCTQCHGDGARTGIAGADVNVKAAPPIGSKGETVTTARAVGAHAAHVNTATLRTNPIACNECHVVPAAGDKTHANGTATLTWGTLAKTGGVTPSWNTTTLSCASTYCHGATLQGGTVTAPLWTKVDGTQKTCSSCHGAPPPSSSGHVQRTDCGSCHAGYSATAVNLATHMNGAVDVVALACTTCHGNASLVAVANADANVKAAPPVDTTGASATTAAGVGVHQSHVNGSRSKPVACAECHSGAVPTTTTGHTKGTTTVAFGTLAKTGNVAPAWNGTALTCASTYCHGNFTGGAGAASTTPAWTAAGALGCTACHGAPPALPHPQNTSCGTCHSGYTSTTVNAVTHVNGVVDQTGTGCTQCHGTPGRAVPAGGDANIAASPPIDTKGNTATTTRGVGAHQTHLGGAALTNPIACSECHTVPATGDKTHANGTAAVTFGTLAKTGSVTPAWNGAAAGGATTCSNVYCHGNFTNGNKTNAPNWTGTSQAACGTCHGIPPAGSHPALTAGTNCSGCHTGYNATVGSTTGTVNLANHVNGKVDVTGGGESAGGSSCGGCHGTIFSMMNGSVAKTTKHTLAADVPNDTGGTWTGNLKTATPYANASCVSMCHGDHPHAITTGGTHEYNVYADANARSTTSSATTRSKTDFDASQTNGGLCISCHLNPVDAAHPAISKTGFTAAAHNFTSSTVGTTTYTWQYTLHDNGAFQRNCTKCHASAAEGGSPTIAVSGSGTVGPHASDFGSLLAGNTVPGATPASLVCYNCHGDGTTGKNMSGKVLVTEAAKAQGHGGKLNSATVHNTATEDAATYNSGAYSGTNRHVSCLDCHDTHMAGKVKHTVGPNDGAIGASSPLNGVSGVGYTGTLPANWTAIPSTNLARVATATAEYQVCFKCHTGWAFGTTPPTGTSGQVETDLAQEFNVNNKAAHPVVNTLAAQTGSTAKGLAATQLLAPWNTNAGNQTMTCTDCHNTDAASTAAQGPHGSAVTFMLAGANKAWPYTSATSNGATTGTLFYLTTSETGVGTANGLFCRNCHPQMNSTGSNSLHRNGNLTGGQHGGRTPSACISCHLRVPHGGKVSRLLVTTNAPARYKLGATPNFAQITKGATKDSYSTSGFPSGFKSSCSEHSSGTGNEAW